jgi:hypothetical protein
LREVLSTVSQSLVESLRLGLEAEGIEAVISNYTAPGLPGVPISVRVVHDADYDRAVAVLRGLESSVRPASSPAEKVSHVVRLVFLVIAVAALCLCVDLLFF